MKKLLTNKIFDIPRLVRMALKVSIHEATPILSTMTTTIKAIRQSLGGIYPRYLKILDFCYRFFRLRKNQVKKKPRSSSGMGILLITTLFNTYASAEEPPHEGIFSLPISQQPGPMVSFGQNIIEKNQIQGFLFPTYLSASKPKQNYTNLSPSLLYGLSNKASLLLSFPVAINYTFENYHSSGYGDTSIQGEYAFYNQDTKKYSDIATIVGNLSIPTGSTHTIPLIGQGSASYLLGTTFNRTWVDWMFFTSEGVYQYRPAPHEKLSTQYLYQAGLGHNLHSIPDKYIFLALLELSGQYSKNSIQINTLNTFSGGNHIVATPSLWFSTKKLILQLAISLPLTEQLTVPENQLNYNTSLSIAWTFR